MTADELDTLLHIQERDTAMDRLHHRRDTMPEREQLATLERRHKEVATRLADAMARRDEVAARQAKLEADIAASETRIGQIDKRMYSGEVSASKDLQAMTSEIESIKRRISVLEDDALGTMEELEPLDSEVSGFAAEDAEIEAQAGDVRAAISVAEAAIDAELAVEAAARAELRPGVPDDVAATYDRLRSRLGGVGAARLEHGSCTGCHLSLPATERERLKKLPADVLVFCEQCGRILVRQ